MPNTTEINPSQGLGPAAGSSIEKGGGNGGKGPLIGTIIVVVLLIAGGAFILANRIKEGSNAETTPVELGPDAATLKLEEQSASTDISSIEKDVEGTDLNSLDKELGDIEKQIPQ